MKTRTGICLSFTCTLTISKVLAFNLFWIYTDIKGTVLHDGSSSCSFPICSAVKHDCVCTDFLQDLLFCFPDVCFRLIHQRHLKVCTLDCALGPRLGRYSSWRLFTYDAALVAHTKDAGGTYWSEKD